MHEPNNVYREIFPPLLLFRDVGSRKASPRTINLARQHSMPVDLPSQRNTLVVAATMLMTQATPTVKALLDSIPAALLDLPVDMADVQADTVVALLRSLADTISARHLDQPLLGTSPRRDSMDVVACTSTTTTIADLPTAVLQHIFAQLPAWSWPSVALTCSRWAAASRDQRLDRVVVHLFNGLTDLEDKPPEILSRVRRVRLGNTTAAQLKRALALMPLVNDVTSDLYAPSGILRIGTWGSDDDAAAAAAVSATRHDHQRVCARSCSVQCRLFPSSSASRCTYPTRSSKRTPTASSASFCRSRRNYGRCHCADPCRALIPR